jgi:peptidoglycan pentaglycine glycine transferase (the first glycine)
MLREVTSEKEWDTLVNSNAGHPLQLWGWGEVKALHGWYVYRYELQSNPWIGVQVLCKKLPGNMGVFAYVPRGPVGDMQETHLRVLSSHMKKRNRAIVVSFEPDDMRDSDSKLLQKSNNTILIPKTIILDLNRDDAALLSDMSKKTRQYIRKSSNEGIEIKNATSDADIEACLAIYRETAQRANFSLHDDSYYFDIYNKLKGSSLVYMAMHKGNVVAFLWPIISTSTSFELYGGVTGVGQELRANYVLKWHVIQQMRKKGITRYDMNGLLNDGVSTFKRGFASHEDILVGTLDMPLSPLYAVWSKGLPAAKKILRTIRR